MGYFREERYCKLTRSVSLHGRRDVMNPFPRDRADIWKWKWIVELFRYFFLLTMKSPSYRLGCQDTGRREGLVLMWVALLYSSHSYDHNNWGDGGGQTRAPIVDSVGRSRHLSSGLPHELWSVPPQLHPNFRPSPKPRTTPGRQKYLLADTQSRCHCVMKVWGKILFYSDYFS